MELTAGSNVFDLLACLCSRIPKEDERKFAIKWKTVSKNNVKKILTKYNRLMHIVLDSSMRKYVFEERDMKAINTVLAAIEMLQEDELHEIYLLAVEIENKIGRYDGWNAKGMFWRMEPLNQNYNEVGIGIYPYHGPCWDERKSERNREQRLNAEFCNYMMIRIPEQSPFQIKMHYWNDKGLLQQVEDGWVFNLAVTPVSDSIELNTRRETSETGEILIVDGVMKEEVAEERITKTFDAIFDKGYSVIMFPEAVGTQQVIDKIKCKMRMFPERCTLVLLPTTCKNEENRLLVLGPGGVEVLSCVKGTPFILYDDKGIRQREQLKYSNEVHILITQELGNVAFPICAEFLDPDFYDVLVRTGRVNTIFCQSFSPGIGAFKNTLVKGLAGMMLSFWLNSCSAKRISARKTISKTISIVQLPDASIGEEPLYEIRQECGEHCMDGLCYFEIKIKYTEKHFQVESRHCSCA